MWMLVGMSCRRQSRCSEDAHGGAKPEGSRLVGVHVDMIAWVLPADVLEVDVRAGGATW